MGVFQPVAAVLLLCLSHASALYSPSSPVTALDSSNFASKLKNGIWMVEFYAPWYVYNCRYSCLYCICPIPQRGRGAQLRVISGQPTSPTYAATVPADRNPNMQSAVQVWTLQATCSRMVRGVPRKLMRRCNRHYARSLRNYRRGITFTTHITYIKIISLSYTACT